MRSVGIVVAGVDYFQDRGQGVANLNTAKEGKWLSCFKHSKSIGKNLVL